MKARIKRIYRNAHNTKRRAWIATREYTDPVLDVGAAEGYMTAAIGSSDITALDIKVLPDFIGGCPFVEGSVYEIPFPDDSFGTVTAFEVLEHLHEPKRALIEIRRVCTHRLYVTVPSFGAMAHVGGHVQDFDDLPALIEDAGFSVSAQKDDASFSYVEAVVT